MKQNKGGRLKRSEEWIFDERKQIALKLLKQGRLKADIAKLFNVHPSQVTRITKDN